MGTTGGVGRDCISFARGHTTVAREYLCRSYYVVLSPTLRDIIFVNLFNNGTILSMVKHLHIRLLLTHTHAHIYNHNYHHTYYECKSL